MKISVNSISKIFNQKSIFNNVTFELESNVIYGISGRNGSGKSTLLKILAGYITPNEGTIQYLDNGVEVEKDKIYKHVTYAAPYIELYEDATFYETLKFHFQLKKIISTQTIDSIVSMLGYDKDLLIKSFSSGMLQRLKLCLAIFSESEILLIDEPTETLDEQGQQWFLDLIKNYSSDRLVVISSNKEKDFVYCHQIISIEDYKS